MATPTVKKEGIISARDVLTEYLKGDVAAVVTYKKISDVFERIEKLPEANAQAFLEQIVGLSDLLGENCKILVHNISKLKWSVLPVDMRESWRTLLCEIGVRHVFHLETIYKCAISNLLPVVTINEENEAVLALPNDDQEELYAMAHSIVDQLLRCIPSSFNMAAKQFDRTFPHYTAPAIKFTSFVRNIVNASEYAVSCREKLWCTLIDNLVGIDALIGHPGDGEDSGAEIFVLEDEEDEQLPEWEDSTAVHVVKLNGAMQSIMQYLSASHGGPVDPNAVSWIHYTGTISESIFSCLHVAFEKHLLTTRNVRFVSFLWMYLGSLHESYPRRILSFLWDVMIRVTMVHGEARKSHGAASYMAAFLARAKYIDIALANEYLSLMAGYLASYVDKVGLSSSRIIPGLAHHGLFYAMANAFFLAFAFRYREIVKSDLLDEVRHWCLGRFIHSSLDPLRYSVCSVARCFAAVSRSLQLIYCNHVLPLSYDDVRRPFDPCFPFDTYSLDKTTELITPITRKFSPMKEDTATLSRELKGVKKEEEEDEGALDFLDDDDMDYGSVKSFGPLSNGLFTTYSSTPGLRPFHVGSPMDTR